MDETQLRSVEDEVMQNSSDADKLGKSITNLRKSIQDFKKSSDNGFAIMKEQLADMINFLSATTNSGELPTTNLGFLGDPPASQRYGTALKSPKVDFPLICGDNPHIWLQKCEKYFQCHSIKYEEWVNLAELHLDDRTRCWYTDWKLDRQFITWSLFCNELCKWFAMQPQDSFQKYGACKVIDKMSQSIENVRVASGGETTTHMLINEELNVKSELEFQEDSTWNQETTSSNELSVLENDGQGSAAGDEENDEKLVQIEDVSPNEDDKLLHELPQSAFKEIDGYKVIEGGASITGVGSVQINTENESRKLLDVMSKSNSFDYQMGIETYEPAIIESVKIDENQLGEVVFTFDPGIGSWVLNGYASINSTEMPSPSNDKLWVRKVRLLSNVELWVGKMLLFTFDPGGGSWFHMVWCSLKTNVDKHDFGYGVGENIAGSFGTNYRWKICPNVVTMLGMVFGTLMSRDIDILLSKSSDPFHGNVCYDSGIADETTAKVAVVVDMVLGSEPNGGFVEKFVSLNAVRPVLDKFPQPIFILTSGDVKIVEQYAYEYELTIMNLHLDSIICDVNKDTAPALTMSKLEFDLQIFDPGIDIHLRKGLVNQLNAKEGKLNDLSSMLSVGVQEVIYSQVNDAMLNRILNHCEGVENKIEAMGKMYAILIVHDIVFGFSQVAYKQGFIGFIGCKFHVWFMLKHFSNLMSNLYVNPAAPWTYFLYILEDKDDFKRGGKRMTCNRE